MASDEKQILSPQRFKESDMMASGKVKEQIRAQRFGVVDLKRLTAVT